MNSARRCTFFGLLLAFCLWTSNALAQAPPAAPVKPAIREAPAASAIESVAPADALVLVQVQNLTGITEGFAKTAVSQTIDQTEMLSAGREIIRNGLHFLVVYLTDTPYDQVWKMMDKGFGLVLLPSKDPFQKPGAAIVIDVSGDKAGFETMLNERFIPRLKTFAENLDMVTEDVQGVKVQTFSPPGKDKVCLALIGGAFAMGAEPVVKSLIAVGKGQSPSIASVAAYQSAKQATAVDAGAFVYVNMAAVFAAMEMSDEDRAKLDAVGLGGIQCIAASAAFQGQGVRERIFVGTGKEKAGLLKHFAELPPKAPTSLALVPQGFSIYATLQSGGGAKLYQTFKEFIRQTQGEEGLARVQAVELAFQQKAQLDIELDLFGPMGNEAFVAADLRKVVEAIPTRKPQFSDVQFILGVEAEDAAKLEGALAQVFFSEFFVNQGITIAKQRYKNSDLNVITDPRRPNMSLTYAFADKFLVFANSTDTMKQVVDAVESKKSLATSEDFAQLQTTMPKESNFMVYLDTKSVLPTLLGVVAQKAPRPLRPFLPALKALADKMTGIEVQLANAPDGIKGEAQSPTGAPFWIVTLASLGNLTKAPVEGKITLANRRMGQAEFAIRRFRQATGRYPTTLGELVPTYMKKTPVDPFSPEKAEIGYVLLAGGAALTPAPAGVAQPPSAVTPAAPKPEGVTEITRTGAPKGPGDFAYLLISVGPDGKKDIDPQDPTIPQLVSKANSTNPEDIATLKAKVYQFRKEQFPEKRSLKDTGDIVKPGK